MKRMELDRRIPTIACLGFGAYWATDYVTFQTLSLFPASMDTFNMVNLFFLVSICAGVPTRLAIAYLRWRRPAQRSPMPLAAVVSLLSISYLGIWLFSSSNVSPPALVACALLHGFAFGWLDIYWLVHFGRQEPNVSRRGIIGAFVIAFGLTLVVASLVPMLSSAFGLGSLLALCALSGVCLNRCMRALNATGPTTVKQSLPNMSPILKIMWKFLLGLAVLAIVYSLADRSTLSSIQIFNFAHAAIMSIAFIGSIVLFVVVRFSKQEPDMYTMCKLALPIAIVACLLIPILSRNTAPWHVILISVGFILVDIVAIATTMELSYEYRIDGGVAGGITRAVVIGFSGIGGVVGYSLATLPTDSTTSIILAFTLAYLLIMGFSLIKDQWASARFSAIDEELFTSGKGPKAPLAEKGRDASNQSCREEATPETASAAILPEEATNKQAFERPAISFPAESPSAIQLESAESVQYDDSERKVIHAVNLYGLTRREEDVYRHLVRGRSVPYIARELGVSDNTVRTHMRHIYEKADVHTKQDLIDGYELF
jgi:DNA-binding CsgD family transcriptional regulator